MHGAQLQALDPTGVVDRMCEQRLVYAHVQCGSSTLVDRDGWCASACSSPSYSSYEHVAFYSWSG